MLDATTIIDYTYKEFLEGIDIIAKTMEADGYSPDYIVGIVRGGATPAVYLSHKLKIPVVMLHWSSRDHNLIGGNEDNFWIPESVNAGQQVLILDDIVDGGDTIRQVLENWGSNVRGELNMSNIKIASLFYNSAQDTRVDYYHRIINRDNDGRWVVFPWEA